MLVLALTDEPRDLTDELLVQIQKQETSPDKDTVLNQLTKSHFEHVLSDILTGNNIC